MGVTWKTLRDANQNLLRKCLKKTIFDLGLPALNFRFLIRAAMLSCDTELDTGSAINASCLGEEQGDPLA
jgi:hypothetical protein